MLIYFVYTTSEKSIYSTGGTFGYKKYCPAILVGLQGIGDGLVTDVITRH